MIVGLSATKILHICCNLINHSTFLQIILHCTCQFGHAIGQTSLETNLHVLMKRKKVWQVFWQVKISDTYFTHIQELKTIMTKNYTLYIIYTLSIDVIEIGYLHDGALLLLLPESFRVLLSCANQNFCYLNLTGTTKFNYERKNEMNSGQSSKKLSLCKWPTGCYLQVGLKGAVSQQSSSFFF